MADAATPAQITRQAIRTPRAAAVAGIVFSVLLTACFVLMRSAMGGESPEGDVWADSARHDALVVVVNMLPFAGIAFLWFIGVLRDRIGVGEDRFFATVFLGSGLLLVAMLFVCGAVAGGLLISSGGTENGPPVELWSFARRVTLNLLTVYAMRMAAVFTISTSTLAARLGLVPRWLALFGGATAAVLLVTAGVVPWLELIFPVWVFILSVYILVAASGSPSEGGRRDGIDSMTSSATGAALP